MEQQTKPGYKSLSSALTWRFSGFIVLASLLFAFFNFMFLYTVEDAFIVQILKSEGQYLTERKGGTGTWPQPRFAFMQLVISQQRLPDDIRTARQENPRQTEFFGTAQKHYHLYALPDHPEHYLLAEVSQQLAVRPLTPFLLAFFAGLTLLLTTLAIWLARKLAKKLIAPLAHLAELVHHTQPHKLPANFAGNYPNNEVGKLADTLQEAMQEIQAYVVREQHFTRDASHELRTPVAIVQNAAELLQQNPQLTEQQKNQIQRIQQAANGMAQTIATLLSLARKNECPRAEVFPLLPLIEKTVLNHHHLLSDKSIEVTVDVPITLQIAADRGAVNILLANIISNAFHYTSAGEIHIRWSDGKLAITDTGTGIPQTLQDNLFEPLKKGANSQGFGIGLSVVKRLCEHHGFEIDIANWQNGTRAELTLPIAHAD